MRCGGLGGELAARGGLELTVYKPVQSPRHQLRRELLTMASHTTVRLLGRAIINAHHPILQSVSATNLTSSPSGVCSRKVPHSISSTPEPDPFRRGRLDLTLCSPGPPRNRPDWWFLRTRTYGAQPPGSTAQKAVQRQPNPTNLRLLQDVVSRARQVVSAAQGGKLVGVVRPFSTSHPPSASFGGMLDGFRCPPRPETAAHPHSKIPKAERLIGVSHTREAPRPTFLLAHATSSTSFDNTRGAGHGEAVSRARGKPDVARPPLSLAQELSSARKKRARTQLGRDGGVTYSMLAHAGPAGDAALLATLNALGWQCFTCPRLGEEAEIHPSPSPGQPIQAQAYLPHQLHG
ncbi:hypothetical protein GWK47_009657 [Chionoecetes opilio]|uniref:Uncharacterized protein n=1 Tax=Chionoecetes opilio TaxID=41210 RepID=A0A8J4XYM2_CHIOP|nr:hypothetical protein GWK47_009657 [Chionoecetes opilio]